MILDRMHRATINDLTFTFSTTGSSSGKPVSLTGSGTVTVNPSRMDPTMKEVMGSQSVSFEMIVDTATNTSYEKFMGMSLSNFPADTWFRSTTTQAGMKPSEFMPWSNMSGLELVGAEQLGGHTVWHLTGSAAMQSGVNSSMDVYVQQDTYLPMKVVMHTAGSTTDSTINYTAINSGVKITMPPPGNVQSMGA